MTRSPWLWRGIKRTARAAGLRVALRAFELYYLLLAPEVPSPAKTTIIFALTYLVSPLDAVPDFVPVAGYADDLAVLAAAINAMTDYLTPEIRARATRAANALFPAGNG